jgi:hypothetical protein
VVSRLMDGRGDRSGLRDSVRVFRDLKRPASNQSGRLCANSLTHTAQVGSRSFALNLNELRRAGPNLRSETDREDPTKTITQKGAA